MNTDTKYKFADSFLKELKDLRSRHEIGSIYWHLFNLFSKEELDGEVERIYKTYKGEDDYYKEEGKESWFYIWHKSVRQVDYFNNVYGYTVVNKLTEDQEKELKGLKSELDELKKKVIFKLPKNSSEEEYKKNEQSYKTLYDMNEYKVLIKKIRGLNSIKESHEDIRLGGIMDSILWNTVHIDNKNRLYETFLRTFSELDIEEKMGKLKVQEEI